ncbi:Uncharacterized amino-acid ABC transporter ATP-binding protein yhdZ [Yersinia aldovae ATCC 35236]|nr:Uncharacterized amino-acid ABC transporter ATP-binding protein yhdZ [Yersinia aldovae ATCC 35236]
MNSAIALNIRFSALKGFSLPLNALFMTEGTSINKLIQVGIARFKDTRLVIIDRVILMDRGEIVDQAPPAECFSNLKSERTQAFLAPVIH